MHDLRTPPERREPAPTCACLAHSSSTTPPPDCRSMHYFRMLPEYWADRLARAKAMGINTVEARVARVGGGI